MSEVTQSRGNTENTEGAAAAEGEGEDGQDHHHTETASCEQRHEVKQSEGSTKVTILVRELTTATGEEPGRL